MKKRILVIVNPAAGKGNAKKVLPLVREKLLGSGSDFELLQTGSRGHATDLARKNARKVTDIVVVGGDGTLNEVVNGMAGSRAVLGIVSAGSGNDFLKSVGSCCDLQEELYQALNGKARAIDLGVCNGRYFINGVGIGFDGKVVEDMARGGPLFKGPLGYYATVLKLLVSYRETEMTVALDRKVFNGKLFMITVANGTTFGGGFRITPGAELDDGWLDVCKISSIGLLRRYVHVREVTRGTHGAMPEVAMLRAKKVRIESPVRTACHIDGEVMGTGPYDIRIIPKGIAIRAGKG
jgi:YegS/Rv2252/BmrU family lipid kinase